MKFFLMCCSALLMTVTAVTSWPVINQPAMAESGDGRQIFNSPLLRGVNLTAKQKANLLQINQAAKNQFNKILTAEQKKTLATQGLQSLQLTPAQQNQVMQIKTQSNKRVEAVFTAAQIRQIKANIQALQSANGQK